MIGVVFHPSTERELVEAARSYEDRAVGLGGDFLREVEHTLAQIVASPEAGSVLTGTVRRRLVRRFPFAVLYQNRWRGGVGDRVMHLRRRPGYWKRRARDRSPSP